MAGSARGGTLSVLLGRLGGVAGSLVLGQLFVGLTYIVAARGLTPAELGVIATCTAIGTIACTVFDAGLNNLLVREVAAGDLTALDARAYVRTKRRLLPVMLVPTVVACLLIESNHVTGALLGLLGAAVWEAQTANSLLRAGHRFGPAATSQIVGRGVGLVLVLVLVLIGAPELGLVIGLLASFALEAAIDRVLLGAPGTPARTQREALPLYREGIGYGLISLAATSQQLDTPLVALGGGAASAGLYAAAGRLINPLSFFANALGLVGSPWLADARRDPERLLAEERRFLRISAVLCLAPLVAAAVGPFVIPFLLGEAYRTSAAVFVVLALGSAVASMNQPLGIVAQNRGRQRTVALAVGIGVGIGLLATYALGAWGGAVWAAVGFLVSQAYILVHLWLVVRGLRRDGAPSSPGSAAHPPARPADAKHRR
ncbi:hypothetical protein GCM10009836_46400 [Pseudonocardia ailaonensis]|uniref:O-antigen/teichoic acid export membrane protein n=1 Tax=Pseudonocardia ailaonensis TaxID=367279 RepID=A0ABN2NB82_9PSEU